ncbi:putative ABC transporter [Zymoseptoria tritici IPO323]|uniref:ABC transporter n=1 Tax=Zymoseptoria tritici (strain CBS 115943 / IPO323) TaxID=336722 RepID=F9XBM8_ZYMTI|nr:putative ABC transporter [Zymoseptoria tritici IPO323]EGP87114.1 putative ABC transporter [Zymoseptoria tritici IPO323]
MTDTKQTDRQRHKRQGSDDSAAKSSEESFAASSPASGDKRKKAQWRSLFVFTTRSHIPVLSVGVITSIAAGATGPAQTKVIGWLYQGFTDYAQGTIDGDEFMRKELKYVLYLTLIGIVSCILHSVDFAAWLAFGELQAKSARDRLFHGLLDKEIEWYDMRKNGIGAMLPRLQAQIRELQLAVAQPMSSLFTLSATAILSLIQAFVVSWDLTLVTLATVPLILGLVIWCSHGMEKNISKQEECLTEAQKYTTSAFASIETVKCFNGQEIEAEKYSARVQQAAQWYAWVAHASALQMSLVVLLSVSMFVQGFYYGGVLVRKGTLNSGDVITTFFSAVGAFQAIQGIIPQMIVFEKGRAAGSTLRTIMAQVLKDPSTKSSNGQLCPETCIGDIDVKDLTFAYPTRPDLPALRNVTMFLKGGDFTFLIGRSGSGKSTIGQLLMRFYTAPHGQISIDGRSLDSLDTNWVRSNITLVEQTSLLFNDSVYRNIAFGAIDYTNKTRAEVMEAAEFALLQLMITDLPQGLDTPVGFKGGSMSGGQRQRMALARARLRDTPILILDESTSALDHISRTLMMEAIRLWRKGKTTIVITHDIGQILPDDYMYLLEDGAVVQEGHRKHLEKLKSGPFQGFLSESQKALVSPFEDDAEDEDDSDSEDDGTRGTSLYSFAMFADDTRIDPFEAELYAGESTKATNQVPSVFKDGSPLLGMRSYANNGGPTSAFASPWLRSSTLEPLGPSKKPRPASRIGPVRPLSGTAESPTSPRRHTQVFEKLVADTGEFAANARRGSFGVARVRRPVEAQEQVKPAIDDEDNGWTPEDDDEDEGEFFSKKEKKTLTIIFKTLWPSLGLKARVYLVLGFWGATVHAIGTPIFAFFISKLLETYNAPGGDTKGALLWSMMVVVIAFIDATHTYMFRFLLEVVSQAWVDSLRDDAYARILDQKREFFEMEQNGVSRLTEGLDRNAEEMRNLVGRFAALVWVAFTMISVTIIWSLVVSWKITLIALAVTPYIWGVTQAFAHVSDKWEHLSNNAAEVAGAIFNETFTNIKTVRALTLETHFLAKYSRATNNALRVGVKRSLYTGLFYGLSDSAGEFSVALIFFVGVKFVRSGTSVTDVIMVFTLLIFTIGNVSAVLAYIPQLGSSKDTAMRLMRLANLPKDSHEHQGDTRIVTVGDIVFDDLIFAYPTRPEQIVLKNISFRLHPSTTTAIVGGSGSGKSTIANLLVDLYNTSSVPGWKTGDLTFGGRDMRNIYTPSLRSLIVTVSQTPTLFAASAAENIAYGLAADSRDNTPESIADAARRAGIHDFIVSLPQGYDTPIGEGGLGLSGGQAQRVSIARALVRKPSVLILDEATSALDVESANLVRQTIRNLVQDHGRDMTVVIITHHRDMMEMAERIVVMNQGRIVQEGTFDELAAVEGPLTQLLSGGEWAGGIPARTIKTKKAKRRSTPMLNNVRWSRQPSSASRFSLARQSSSGRLARHTLTLRRLDRNEE